MKRILLISLSVLALLLVVLVVHIRMVTADGPMHLANVQMARIDLAEPIDSTQAVQLRSVVLKQRGVIHCFVNRTAGTIVYGYDRALQNQDAVHAAVAAASPVETVRYTVTAEASAGSCPVIDKESLSGKFSAWVQAY